MGCSAQHAPCSSRGCVLVIKQSAACFTTPRPVPPTPHSPPTRTRTHAHAHTPQIREENPRLARDSKVLRVTMDNVYEVFTTPRDQTGLGGIHFRFMPDMGQVRGGGGGGCWGWGVGGW